MVLQTSVVSDELTLLCSPNIIYTLQLLHLGSGSCLCQECHHLIRPHLLLILLGPAQVLPPPRSPTLHPPPHSGRVFPSLRPHHGLLSSPEALNTLLSNNRITGEGQLSSGGPLNWESRNWFLAQAPPLPPCESLGTSAFPLSSSASSSLG